MVVGKIGRREITAMLGGGAALGCGVYARVANAQMGSVMVRVRDAVEKLVGPARISDDPAATIELAAARNEFETAQLILQATAQPIDDLRVKPGSLKAGRGGEIGPENIQTFLVHYTSIDQPSDSRGGRGRWPDALMPLAGPLRVRHDVPCVLWIRVRVPKGAVIGTYRGALGIEAGGRPVREVPITLRVFGATLSDAPTLPFIVGLDFESIHRLDGGGLDAARFAQQVLPAYYASLKEAGAGPFVLFDAMPRISGSGTSLRADFAPYDRRIAEVYGGWPQLPFPAPFGLSQPISANMHPPFTPGWDAAVVTYLGQLAKHLETRGGLERAFIYVQEADEPTTRDRIDRIAHLQRLIRSADKRLRMVQTVHVRCFDCTEDTFDLLDSEVTLWTPNIAFANGVALGMERVAGVPRPRSFPSNWEASMKRRRRGANSDVWWYLNPATTVLPGPHPGYPSLHVDHEGMAHRALAWTAWSHRVTAVGHWMATFWRGESGPWQRVPRGEGDKGTNGDGVLLYPRNGASAATAQPDPGGPTSSMRLELIREGGEDHKLITLAEQVIGRQATERLVQRVAPSAASYSADPAVLRSTRLALLEATSR
jgi:hypothetical protein